MALAFHRAVNLSLPGIAHGFFGNQGGVSEGLYASLNCGPGSRDDPARVAEPETQSDIQPGRQRDDAEAGPDRQIELETEINREHGSGLADDGQPAQPHQCIEPHGTARLL